MDRATARGGCSLTTCSKADSVLADGVPCNPCGCSSAGRARRFQRRGHEFETRHPLHFGCVHALRCRVTWCWRYGMCATLGQVTCSETPHPTGCSRLGTAEVESMSRSSSWRRTPGVQSGDAGSEPHAMPEQPGTPTSSRSGVEIGRNDWAAPEPVTGWMYCLVSSAENRAPACEAGGRTFESCTRYQHCRSSSMGRAAASKAEGSRFDSVVRRQTSRRSQVVEGGGLQSRRRKPPSVRIGSSSPGLVSSADESGRLLPGGSAVRIGHEVPVHFPGGLSLRP